MNKLISERQLLLAGIIAHIAAALFSIGFHHFDEHFQIIEFAGYKLGTNSASDLTWEFRNRMRPALQPGMAYALIKSLSYAGLTNPFTLAIIFRLLAAAVALASTLLLLHAFSPEVPGRKLRMWLVLLSLLTWFIVYSDVRFSSENISGALFAAALGILWVKRNDASLKPYLLAGLLAGLSVVLRFQTGFMVAGLGLWLLFIGRASWPRLIAFGSMILACIAFGVVIDRWFYGEWTFTFWNYFDQNIVHDKAANFGIDPPWYYITNAIGSAVPPYSIIMVAAVFYFIITHPKHVITWIVLPFLLIHFAVGHKEMRFLFPVLKFIPFMLVLSILHLRSRSERIKRILESRHWKWLTVSFLVVNTLLLLVIIVKPANRNTKLYQYIYNNYNGKPVRLMYNEADPFVQVTRVVRFYKPPSLVTVKDPLLQLSQMPPGGDTIALFVAIDTKGIAELDGRSREFKKVYSDIPEWMKNFNFNNWLSRTNQWTLYEISPQAHTTSAQ